MPGGEFQEHQSHDSNPNPYLRTTMQNREQFTGQRLAIRH